MRLPSCAQSALIRRQSSSRAHLRSRKATISARPRENSLWLRHRLSGVETGADLAVLRRATCDLVQGYLIAQPMAAEAFEAWRAALARPIERELALG